MSLFWPLSRQQVLDANGRPLLDARVGFFAPNTSTPLAVFADSLLAQALPVPVQPDATGRFPRVYLPAGVYRERMESASLGLLWDDDGLGTAVPAATGSTGSGSGSAVDPLALLQTGDVKWRLDSGIYPGFVRANGRTLGNAASGATELASASAQALYLYLWNTFADDLCPVNGGRGSTAVGDFTGNKAITLPDMRGRVPAGLDDMGSSAALRLQAAASLALTPASNVATVSSSAGLALGMSVFGTGVAAGTTILDIQGTQLTLSIPATGGGTVIGRFGALDAQRPGAAGGQSVQTVQNRNLPATLPPGTLPAPQSHTYARNKTVAAASLTTASGSTTIQDLLQGLTTDQTTPPAATAQNTTVPIANPNGGVPLATGQPSLVGTFYLKL